MSLVDPLAEFVATLSLEKLSDKSIAKLEDHVLDSIGAMLAGRSSEDTQAVCGLMKKTLSADSIGDIPVPGLDFSASLLSAAMISTVSARMTETDDIHLPSCTTPGSVIVPAAICAACHAKTSGKRLLEGILAGYEIMTRLGTAVRGAEIVYQGTWPTYLCAAAGTAAAGAHIFNLSADQGRHALAIALSLTTGLAGKIMTGLSSRWLTVGRAVQNGLLAALAAGEGYAGDPDILDGPFAAAHNLDMDAGALLTGLGGESCMLQMSLKPYCTARQALSPIEAFRGLLAEDRIDPASVREILISVPAQYQQMIDHPDFPTARVPSIVSVQYQLALAAYHEADLYDLHRVSLKDEPALRNLMSKVRLISTPEYTALYPRKWAAKVTLTTVAGSREKEITTPYGDPETPMGRTALLQKMARLVRPGVSPDALEGLASTVKDLKNQKNLDDLIQEIAAI